MIHICFGRGAFNIYFDNRCVDFEVWMFYLWNRMYLTGSYEWIGFYENKQHMISRGKWSHIKCFTFLIFLTVNIWSQWQTKIWLYLSFRSSLSPTKKLCHRIFLFSWVAHKKPIIEKTFHVITFDRFQIKFCNQVWTVKKKLTLPSQDEEYFLLPNIFQHCWIVE